MFNENKFKFIIKGKYDDEIGAIHDITLEGKGAGDALINALVLACVSFARKYDISEKEVIRAIKETFKEEGEK